jgi:hypothetical protein
MSAFLQNPSQYGFELTRAMAAEPEPGSAQKTHRRIYNLLNNFNVMKRNMIGICEVVDLELASRQ